MVRRAGFSLVEVVVAMTMLAVGVLGVAGGGLLALRLLHAAEFEEQVAERAGQLLDSLVVHNVHGAGALFTNGYRLDWIANADSVAVTIVAAGGATFMLRELK